MPFVGFFSLKNSYQKPGVPVHAFSLSATEAEAVSSGAICLHSASPAKAEWWDSVQTNNK